MGWPGPDPTQPNNEIFGFLGSSNFGFRVVNSCSVRKIFGLVGSARSTWTYCSGGIYLMLRKINAGAKSFEPILWCKRGEADGVFVASHKVLYIAILWLRCSFNIQKVRSYLKRAC